MKPTLKCVAACSAVILLGLTACNNNSRHTYDLSDISDATLADSIMYYSGQMRAAEYWDDALEDDTLAFPHSREKFLEGVEDGIKTSKEDKIYNMGFKTGQRIADNCKRFTLRYGQEFNPVIVFRSLRSGLRADTVVDIVAARREFYSMVNSCEEIHSEKVLKAAATRLRREVKGLGMEQISDYIYGKTEHPGTGTKLKPGDPVRMVSDIRTMDGEKINYTTMDNFNIGNRYMNDIITTALLTMSPGEIKKFAMPAIIVIGENCLEYDLKPSETLLVTLSVFSDHDKKEIK